MVNGDNPKIIFSTAEPYFSLPETIFNWIWDKQLALLTANGASYTTYPFGSYFAQADGEAYLKDMDILIDGYWIEIPIESLFYSSSSGTTLNMSSNYAN